jgi:phosphate transport system permease protein
VDERNAAFGLGATRWEVMRHVVLPRARAGIIGATMLGLGRALGETIAVLLVIGGSAQITINLFQPGQTIAGQIASGFGEASPEGIRGLIALGVALFALTILINVAARAIVWRIGRPGGDRAL